VPSLLPWHARLRATGGGPTKGDTVPGPLEGIRILDLSIALTGPYAAALLGDQGAEVVKVERPGIGDLARWVGVSVNGVSALYQACNRGKRCIAVDISTPDGQELVRRLAADCDVFIQNSRPGAMERAGLGWDDLSAGRDDLVYLSLSGFGSEGPYAGHGAYDTVIQAYAGLASNQADPEIGEPVFIRQTAADKITAMYAVQAITAALLARERGAGGQHIELSMTDSVVSFLWADCGGNELLMDADGSMSSSFVQGSKPFRFADGWGIATPTSDADFHGMCEALGVDGHDDPRVATIGERRKHPEVSGEFMRRCHEAAATLTTAQASERMQALKVPFGLVVPQSELPADPHAVAIGLFEESEHPVAGRLRQPRHPARFAGTPAALGAPSPGLGEHTDEILAEIGLDPAAVRDLHDRGVTGRARPANDQEQQ
jgi:crotonobetainyl-CoA:carnitine CoA-transferase CaiB-like acyl-CoA transferase